MQKKQNMELLPPNPLLCVDSTHKVTSEFPHSYPNFLNQSFTYQRKVATSRAKRRLTGHLFAGAFLFEDGQDALQIMA